MDEFPRLRKCMDIRLEVEHCFAEILKAFRDGKKDEVLEHEACFKKLHIRLREAHKELDSDKAFQKIVNDYNATKKETM